MFQPRQQQRFPPIAKPPRFKLLQDVTQQPYRIGMVQYYPNNPKTILENDSETDDDDETLDPGREVIERNRKERLQRSADHTKEELDKVLKRVDNTLNNYEYSVQSSLIQHGMLREEMNSVEHVQDIRELEYLLNDNLAKQRYKQRLMVFIVGQTEQASEKAKLLQQLGQFFTEQKQNFSGAEFNDYDDTGETHDEIETTLKSFDVKDCYLHVKTLTERINELNEEIIQFLIQNTGTKQTKVMVERGKRKLAQVTKEAKEQLADLQTKLEAANAEMMGKDGKIQVLEKDIDTTRNEVKTSQESQKKLQDEVKRREAEIKFFKRRNNELEEILNRYKSQVGDLPGITFATSQSETEDGDDASKMNLETIDENESKYEKESISSRTAREQIQSTSVPPTTTDATNNAAKTTPVAPPPVKSPKKSKTREKKRAAFRSKKEATNQSGAEDPSEIYRRSQQLLESLLADKSENAPDLNSLFKPTRGIDLNNVTIDNLPTAFTNLRKFAITRVRELLKELETKESANKETVQILKQEFVEHKTTYEKERLLYFLSLDPDENILQEEQNALAEKADHAHKLQMKAQKTAEDALNHLELFMAEQEKLDQQDVVRQTELVHRHSIVVNNMTGANITPPDPMDEPSNDRLSPNPKRSTPSKTQWQKLSSIGNVSPKPDATDGSKSTIYETAQTLKRLSSTFQKTPPIDPNDQPSPPTPLLRKTTQELLRKKSSLEQPQYDRSASSSRRISMAINDDTNLLSKVITPQGGYDRTPSMHSRPLTRSNSINPGNKDQEKNSSGERSYHTSAAQSRRVSIGLNRSPVRAEELEIVLTKLVNEEIEALENYRRTSVKSRTSLREKYMSLLEEKKHELDDLKQQADETLSRPTTSTKERKPFESLENSTILLKKQSSFSPLDTSHSGEIINNKENRTTIIKLDQQQQTSRPVSAQKEKPIPQIIQNDQFKVPFFHLYETIYKFRHSIINLLEQNKFLSLADRLDMIKQLSASDNNPTNDFVDNSERVLKDTVKVLQTCMSTGVTTPKNENVNKEKQISNEQIQTKPMDIPTKDNQIIQEKEIIIEELNNKYQEVTQNIDETKKKYEEELTHNERVIVDQQKLIQNLQRELMRLQKRLSKIEVEGIVQPSVMFTRLDAERNEQTLKQAVEKGKVSETAVNEINDTMADYNRLPSQQFSNIVKRYIQHRKATELEDRIQSETFDNEAKSVMERMGSFYERRSGQISERISSIRQHRSTLARALTEKFDNLEHESSIFLIRPVYSYQGRTAVQSYMKNEKRQQEAVLQPTTKKKKHRRTDSASDRQTANKTASSSTSTSDDDERLFNIEKSFTMARPTPASQQSVQHADSTGVDNQQKTSQLIELPRLQQVDIYRTLMPMSHASVPLSTINSNNGNDPSIPSSNLRSYVALSRPGVNGNLRNIKSDDVTNPVSRIELSVLSATSQITNPRTPFNSTVGVSRRSSPPLPPIKRSLTTSKTPPIDEKATDEFIPSVSINEFVVNDQTKKDENTENKP